MNYEFNKEYLTKTLMSLVRDEGNRVINANLATNDDVRSLVRPILELVVDNVGIHGPDVLLNTLTVLHEKLSSVKLPGDFKKMSCDLKRHFGIILGYTQQEDIIPDNIDIIEDEKEDDIDAMAQLCNIKEHVLNRLANMAYELGSNGNHKVAYLIERKIHEIEAIKSK